MVYPVNKYHRNGDSCFLSVNGKREIYWFLDIGDKRYLVNFDTDFEIEKRVFRITSERGRTARATEIRGQRLIRKLKKEYDRQLDAD